MRFRDCLFSDVTYGCLLTDDVFDILFEGCTFTRCFRGLSLGEGLGAGVPKGGTVKGLTYGVQGPTTVTALACNFEGIQKEGASIWRFESNNRASSAHFRAVHGLAVAFCRFYDVGNGLFSSPNDTNQYWCVYFSPSTIYNIAIGNRYSRNTTLEDTGQIEKRVYVQPGSSNIVLDPQDFAHLPHRRSLLDPNVGVPTPTGIVWNINGIESITVEYTLANIDDTPPNATRRRGQLFVVTDGTSVEWTEELVEVRGDLDTVVFTPVVAGSVVEIRYTNSSATDRYALTWSIRHGHAF